MKKIITLLSLVCLLTACGTTTTNTDKTNKQTYEKTEAKGEKNSDNKEILDKKKERKTEEKDTTKNENKKISSKSDKKGEKKPSSSSKNDKKPNNSGKYEVNNSENVGNTTLNPSKNDKPVEMPEENLKPNKPQEPQAPITPPTPDVDIKDVTGYASELMGYINNYRAQNGLHALQYHAGAQAFANKRAYEIMSKFSHSTQYDIRNETGLEPASENIAKGSSPIGTFNLWKNSSGHNYNMLHPLAVYGAIGVVKDDVGRTYWVMVTLQDVISEGGWQ